MVAITQDLCHIIQNFMHMTVYYLGTEGPLSCVMATLPCHIDHFERQYENALVGKRLFGADIVDRIHKRVHVFLHLCNTTLLKDVDIGALA